MIDTIVLMLPSGSYTVLDHGRFDPSSRGLFVEPYYPLGARSSFRCVQNPTASELKAGIYKPRLTITKRIVKGGFETPLKVELSLPKLLFGNNFDELRDEDFERLADLLQAKLKDMGVFVLTRALHEAPVSAVHYAKNIPLTDYATSSMVTRELEKVNLTIRLDVGRTSFRNEGHVLHFHANSFEVVFYDKVKDLEQARGSEKRAVESDNTIQMNLFDRHSMVRPFEVLRMEARLNSRAKIRQILRAVGFPTEPTFRNVFSATIARKVLLHFWQEAWSAMFVLAVDAQKPIELLEAMRAANPATTTAQALRDVGSIVVLQDGGARRFRNALGLHGKKSHTWYRLTKRLRALRLPTNPKYQAITQVERQLDEFKPLRLDEYRK